VLDLKGLAMTLVKYLLYTYIASFVLFALIRLTTGISIKRLGYLCVRGISFSPKAGVQINIGKVGFLLHRPSFARPGWINFYVSGLDISIDPVELEESKSHKSKKSKSATSCTYENKEWTLTPPDNAATRVARSFLTITRFIDFAIYSTTVDVKDVSTFILAQMVFQLDLRSHIASRRHTVTGTLYENLKLDGELPAFFTIIFRELLVKPSGDDYDDEQTEEILDSVLLEVRGFLKKKDLSLKRLAVNFKLGRINVLVDKLMEIKDAIKKVKKHEPEPEVVEEEKPHVAEADAKCAEEAAQVKANFATLLIRTIREVEVHVAQFGVYHIPASLFNDSPTDKLSFAIMAKDFNLDLRRLNPKSPAFRMYFESDDTAHQTIFSVISVVVGLSVNKDVPEELVYVPMVTLNSKTNMFSRTLSILSDSGSATTSEAETSDTESDAAAPIYSGQLITGALAISSPTVDLQTHHVPLLLTALNRSSKSKPPKVSDEHFFMKGLKPATNLKVTIEEPAARVLVTRASKDHKARKMVISSCEAIVCNLHSSHENLHDNDLETKYKLQTSLKVVGYSTWYRSPEGSRHDILDSQILQISINADMAPKLLMTVDGQLLKARFDMTEAEVVRGLREVVQNVRRNDVADQELHAEAEAKAKEEIACGHDLEDDEEDPCTYDPTLPKKPNALRKLPCWLQNVNFESSESAIAVGLLFHDDTYKDVSTLMVIGVEKCVLDYKNGVTQDGVSNEAARQYALEHSDQVVDETDDRRFVVSVKNVLAKESISSSAYEDEDDKKFDNREILNLPSLDMAVFTTSNKKGPYTQTTVMVPKVLMQYSAHVHWFVTVHLGLLLSIFHEELGTGKHSIEEDEDVNLVEPDTNMSEALEALQLRKKTNKFKKLIRERRMRKKVVKGPKEEVTVNLAIAMMRIKWHLPHDFWAMLELDTLTLDGRDLKKPIILAKYLRLYGTSPTVEDYWNRILIFRGLRVRADVPLIKETLASTERVHEDPLPCDERDDAVTAFIDGMQLCIPNQFICYTILDNILSGVKSIAHISQRLRLNTSDVVVWPKVMKPRAIPKVRIHTPRLLVIVEDDPFESQLNLIFQVGYKEQQSRLEKEKAFEEYSDRIMASRLPKKRSTRVATEDEIGSHKEGGHHHNLASIGTGLKDVFHKKHKNDSSDPQNSSSGGYKDTTTVSIEQAEEELRRNFATSWIINFNAASDERKLAVSDLYGTVWGDEQIAEDTAKNENILEYSDNPPLMSMYHKDVDWVIDRVQFPIAQIPDFLYDVGKGQPKDTVYTIMLPFFWNVQMGEWRINLRDYPLPLVHFPPLHPSQDASGPAVSFHGTFIVGEMLSEGIEYVRRIKVPLAPFVHPDEIAPSTFMMEVFRTVTSVKVFTNLTFEGHSISPTRINWGSSMSPAISAGFGAIDTFSKPPADHSPKPGFWDKARLIAHGRFKLKWDKSDIHFVMKSSKNPYAVLGDDAGLVWVWRNHVVWDINGEDNPKEFMRVDSEEFMLAVPNLGLSEREYLLRAFNAKDYGSQGQFLKVIMKVVGKVRWLAGVAFERDDPEHPGERTDKFKPHYEVITKNSAEINDPHWDAFRGFRSEYIHLALSVRNPQGRDWINATEPEQQAYNAIHLSPETFSHFKKWWHMFDSSTSMPARHGRLWMSPEERRELKKAPKKVSFGKSMHTVKYMIQLSQLFICHLYRHPENEDEASKHTRSAATGIKLRTDAYMMELHQRREPIKGSDVWKMKLNAGEIDFQSCDIRVISAVFKEESAHGVLARHMGLKDDVSSLGSSTNNTNSHQSGTTNTGSSRVGTFQISDGDFSWIDMDDFVEINESTPDGKSPEVAVIPMLYTPRWTYFRETDHEQKEYMTDSRGNKYRRFGDETNVLDGFLGKIAPQLTQIRLFEEREKDLAEQIKTHEAMLDSLKHGGNQSGQAVKDRIASVEETLFNLKTRYHVISHTCLGIRAPGESSCGPNSISERIKNELNDVNETKFNNRFIVHNVHLKWNNIVRNAMFRYLHRVEERKKLTYFMSRGAVKRIEDLLKELDKTMADDHYTSEQKQERAKKVTTNLLQEAAHMIDNRATCQERVDTMEEGLYNTYSDPNITIDNTYLVKLVSPQVQLMSEQNPDKVVMLTAPNISLRITSAIDESDIDADFKGVVEKRHGVQLEHANFFVLDREAVLNRSAFLMNNNNYGCHRNSLWPPWLAIEMCYDATALRDDVVVSDATVGLRYDKPNTLRLKSLQESAREARCTEDEEKEAFNRFNRIEVDFPKVTAYCTSEQYFAIYTIAMDLLLYSEPIKESNKKAMDRMLMTFDPKRLHSAPETIECLQNEMRRLRKIRDLMQTQKDGKKDVRQIDVELASGYLELFTMMAATTKILVTSKETEDFTDTMKWAIGSDEIIWHLLEDDHTPLVDFGMASPSFVRFQEPNGANTNCMEIQMMQGFNLKPNAPYPEMLGPFLDGDVNKNRRNAKLKKLDEPALVYAAWKMLAPIGGIPVMELLEVQLQPLKLALDQDTAEKMFSYVFPKNNDSPFNVHDPTKHKTMADAVAIYADSDNGSDLTGGNESLSSSLASRLDASPNNRYQVVGVKMPGDPDSPSASSTRKSMESDSSDESSSGRFNIFRNRRRQDESDEGTQMMERASEYTSIVDIRLHSAVICISLKGHGTKALADVHNFVFTIPDLVYQNKTWTNLDLANQVKKDVIRALLQHTGSLLRNKIRPHKRETNSAPLRQISEYTKFTAVDDLRADKDSNDHQNGRAGLESRAGTFTQPSSASVSRKPSTDSSLRKVTTSKSKESNGKEHRKSGFFHRLRESL
jgi:hypothetical protein